MQTDEQILAEIRLSFNTVYHASATNKMGQKKDSMAVVDSRCKVYGAKRLRVVDASAFPFLPPGHPMSTICKSPSFSHAFAFSLPPFARSPQRLRPHNGRDSKNESTSFSSLLLLIFPLADALAEKIADDIQVKKCAADDIPTAAHNVSIVLSKTSDQDA